MSRPRIIVAETYDEAALARLRLCGEVIELASPDLGQAAAVLREAQALLVRSYAQVTESVIAGAPSLRVIGRGGIGIENIDVSAARSRGVVVVHTPLASTRSAAEHALALLLAVEHRILSGDRAVRSQEFMKFRAAMSFQEMSGRTLGIVGMGRIGSEVARICAAALGMRVLYNDIVPVGPFDFPAESVTKEELYRRADVISLHVPLTQHTRSLIDEGALRRFRPEAVLINTSRGPVVEGHALARALEEGRLDGAGLDVFDPEPLPAGHPLLSAPNAVLSPHVAGRSVDAQRRMNDVVDDVIAVLEGRAPRFSVE